MTAAVEIYTRPGCGYCTAAKSLLTRKSIAFTEFDSGVDPKWRDEMYGRVGAGVTFPQIFIDRVLIGGCDDLYALDRGGRLDAMISGRISSGEKAIS